MKFCRICLIAALVFPEGALFADTVYNCGGKYQTSPCVEGGGSPLFVSTPKPRADRAPDKEMAASVAGKRGVCPQDADVRPRRMRREEPRVLSFNPRPTDNDWFRTRLTGEVEAQGPLDIDVYVTWVTSNDRIERKLVTTARAKCPEDGGRCPFEVVASNPKIHHEGAYIWTIVARNGTPWRGYPNLQGCCSWHEGVASCATNGRVLCGDGEFSPTCCCEL